MEYAIVLAIGVGLAGGVLFGFRWSKAVAKKLSANSHSPRLVVVLAAVGGVVSVLPAGLLSFVVGGNVGGGYGEVLTAGLGLGSVGVPFGLALGIGTVLSTGVALGASIGGLFGKALAYLVAR